MCKPRRFVGDRSPRYEARREARGVTATRLPGWSDAGASRTLGRLHTMSSDTGEGITGATLRLLRGTRAAQQAFVQALGLSALDKAVHHISIKFLRSNKAYVR